VDQTVVRIVFRRATHHTGREDARVNVGFCEGDGVAVAGRCRDHGGDRLGDEGIQILIDIRDSDADGIAGCIGVRRRAVVPRGELSDAGGAHVLEGDAELRRRRIKNIALVAFVGDDRDVEHSLIGAGKPGVFVHDLIRRCIDVVTHRRNAAHDGVDVHRQARDIILAERIANDRPDVDGRAAKGAGDDVSVIGDSVIGKRRVIDGQRIHVDVRGGGQFDPRRFRVAVVLDLEADARLGGCHFQDNALPGGNRNVAGKRGCPSQGASPAVVDWVRQRGECRGAVF